MRIALLTYSTKPRGGVVHTLALAEALARRGESVTVATLGRGGDRAFFRPVERPVALQVIPFPDGPRDETVGQRVLRSIDTLAAGFNPASFDVVHAEDCITANAVPGSIRTVHHIDDFETPELVRCHERAIREPAAHICVSPAVAAELAQGWGITAVVIPNGVDYERFARAAEPGTAAARASWHARVGGPYVLTVGGIEPRKGTLDLLEAFAILRQLRPDMSLVIAGGETLFDYRSYRVAFDQRCSELGVKPMVLGPVPHDELPSLVAGAAVFALASVKEGFGLVAFEAAAAGVPLVLRDLPVFRQTLDRAAAFAVSPATLGEQLVLAMRAPDPDRLNRARRRAARFSWDAAARAHQQVYSQVATRAAAQSSGISGLEPQRQSPFASKPRLAGQPTR